MDTAILITTICLSILLIVSVIFQKMGGGGLGGAFGGSGNDFQTRRGMEKYLFYLTILCIIGIGSLSLLYLFL